ncbi:unnamed protein product [Didymodactylos carnosus]|uniref:DNA topoisomerase 2 n=1 Tax=Didymodactylos carnosus TaxID=1234261 RepID=A0A813QRK6_9BILA|nr:unnamed protein product [Didymodactylos carnosus]CAF0798287.1 unnamed protein product [Didymodactylos carnosus]CAF3554332.1 unnamed protein product [Didymodactylos carnosus]CAF3581468.1 unnamed protein product [Didymodactylos carnosus]
MANKSMTTKAEDETYQLLEQLDHILKRPETYIGSTKPTTEDMWIVDDSGEEVKIIKKEVTYVPGLYKIFDEILVNAADNKQRDPTGMSSIDIHINGEKNEIKICNDGKGVPVRKWAKDETIYIPTLIFGQLLTSDNFNDDKKRITGGRNGYGAKVTNIFSSKFIVETSSKEFGKTFKQVWTNNMRSPEDAQITKTGENAKEYTRITFYPDLKRFGMDKLDDDMISLFKRRAYDVAVSTNVKVTLNGKKLAIKSLKDYIQLYVDCEPNQIVHKKFNDRWEIGVVKNEQYSSGQQQVSFVNSILTSDGGKHVDYISEQIAPKIVEAIKKKNKQASELKPAEVKKHLFLFVNCLIENPEFDSQAKKQLSTTKSHFGSKCEIKDDEAFIKDVVKKCGIIEQVIDWLENKQTAKLNKQSGSKTSKLKGIPKLDDANDAGTKNSIYCTLIVTEGDSAKALAVAGLGVIGRDRYGCYPLRGKMLNVREAANKKVTDNNEITQLCKILGLNYKETYETKADLNKLRYGKLMIMADQDFDGSHIKGLVINFIHYNWPNLLKHDFIEVFITPILKVTKGKTEIPFYSMPEFEEWQEKTKDWAKYKMKYYKGLGTSTAKEAKEYFSTMDRHRIVLKYLGTKDDLAIHLAFNGTLADDRKDWIKWHSEDLKNRREQNLPIDYLYKKNTKQINYTDFVNKELILFSKSNTERAIPNIMDGFKPGQRKIMYVCFTKNIIREIKVAQLGGKVAEYSAYHHGEISLTKTIVGLAQNFVGANNINLLVPAGQFGTRINGGDDAASARYIFTKLSSLALALFNKNDEALLTYLNEDGMRIEPEWYCPLIPMVLVNGATGVGTGYSTDVLNYDPMILANNMRYYIRQEKERRGITSNYPDTITLKELIPSFKNFTGETKLLDNDRTRGVINGVCAKLDDQTIEITDLPVGIWTQTYKEATLEQMLSPKDGTPPLILDYKEYHTDTTVRFVVKMTPQALADYIQQGLHKVLFDHNNVLRLYNNVEEICEEFFTTRLYMYVRRKEYMVGSLQAICLKLDNVARFIKEKIEGVVAVENKKISKVVEMLIERKYDRDPEKVWREESKKKFSVDIQQATSSSSNSDDALDDMQQKQDEEENDDDDDGSGNQNQPTTGTVAVRERVDTTYYDYLINMSLRNLTKEKRDDILREQKAKHDTLEALKSKTPEDLYEDDLDNFENEYKKQMTKEKADEMTDVAHYTTKKVGGPASKKQKPERQETKPAPHGQKIAPVIDPNLLKKSEDEQKKRKREEKVTDKQKIIDFLIQEGITGDQLASLIPEAKKKRVKGAVTSDGKKIAKEKESPVENIINSNTEFSGGNESGKSQPTIESYMSKDIILKSNPKRVVKEKVQKYKGADDSDDSEQKPNGMDTDGEDDDVKYLPSEDSDYEKPKAKKLAKPKPATTSSNGTIAKKSSPSKPNAFNVLMSSNQLNVVEKAKKTHIKKETNGIQKEGSDMKTIKPTVKRTKAMIKDESDNEVVDLDDSFSSESKKPRRAGAKKVYTIADDSENDFEN